MRFIIEDLGIQGVMCGMTDDDSVPIFKWVGTSGPGAVFRKVRKPHMGFKYMVITSKADQALSRYMFNNMI